MTTSPAEVAKCLTEAQRRAICWLYGPHQGQPQERRYHGWEIHPEASASVMASLELKGLVMKRGSAGWPIYFKPTDLGLAVRSILTEKTNG
jgi:hypothetical protein